MVHFQVVEGGVSEPRKDHIGRVEMIVLEGPKTVGVLAEDPRLERIPESVIRLSLDVLVDEGTLKENSDGTYSSTAHSSD